MTDVSAFKSAGMGRHDSARRPTRAGALVFAFKAGVFRLQRLAQDGLKRPKRLDTASIADFPIIAAESRTKLWSDERLTERRMQDGKVQNLRIAVRHLDRLDIPCGATFSFWGQLGRPTRARGFVDGRMLQEGCLVPSVGGGLCQLSNALYEVALQAGCEIVERHPHSRIVAGSAATIGRDATVAWNYVDLRFRSARRLMLCAVLERDELVVQLRAADSVVARARLEADGMQDSRAAAASCGSCGEISCFRHESAYAPSERRTAFLVDEAWPEFRFYLACRKRAIDRLGIPLDGARWGVARYKWDTDGFAKVSTATASALFRSLASRRLAAQGPARQIAQLKGAEALAFHLTRLLSPDVTDVCVAQSLLPYLWRDGHLGGRRFSVLMTRLPIHELQQTLDRHAALHPERTTLSDFRAPSEIADWEAAALAAADRIVTPHAQIARLFRDRAVKLEWTIPKVAQPLPRTKSRRVAFPSPTVARKGCYELRDAARLLDLEIVPLGGEIENVWADVRTGRPDTLNWLTGIAAVVQPAFVEHSPRRLMAALAAGVPVIATPECGLDAQSGLTLVPAGDVPVLVNALGTVLD